jgi:hypothetical protein
VKKSVFLTIHHYLDEIKACFLTDFSENSHENGSKIKILFLKKWPARKNSAELVYQLSASVR